MTQTSINEKHFEIRKKEINDLNSLLVEAEHYALQGNVHYMERALLGIAASGVQDQHYYDLTEKIQVLGYTRMIKTVIRSISDMNEQDKEKYLHQQVFSLLHAGSMTHQVAFRGALQIALKQEHPEAKRAIKDFCPTLNFAKRSMMEHHKTRNNANSNYFDSIQLIMQEDAGSLVSDCNVNYNSYIPF